MSNKTRVVNIRYTDCDVYIGRNRVNQPPNIWGNPFHIGKDGTREEVIDMYKSLMESRIASGEVTVTQLLSLKGKRLGCWCHPLPCHGNVLIELINEHSLTKSDSE